MAGSIASALPFSFYVFSSNKIASQGGDRVWHEFGGGKLVQIARRKDKTARVDVDLTASARAGIFFRFLSGAGWTRVVGNRLRMLAKTCGRENKTNQEKAQERPVVMERSQLRAGRSLFGGECFAVYQRRALGAVQF